MEGKDPFSVEGFEYERLTEEWLASGRGLHRPAGQGADALT
jgi:hypothetical protein